MVTKPPESILDLLHRFMEEHPSPIFTIHELITALGEVLSRFLTTNGSVEHLCLRSNLLKYKDARFIAAALGSNTRLLILSLKGNRITLEGGIALLEGLDIQRSLQILDMRYNILRMTGPEIRAHAAYPRVKKRLME